MDADKTEAFEEEIGMRRNPVKDAREALLAWQEAAGVVIADPDAPVAPDAKAIAMAENEELDRSSTWMGGPRR